MLENGICCQSVSTSKIKLMEADWISKKECKPERSIRDLP